MHNLHPRTTIRRAFVAATLVTAAFLASCATTPQRNYQLDAARAAVRGLEQDPDARAAASQQLRDARNDLQRANDASEKRRPPDEVTYFAYLADREAQTGSALANEYRAHQQITQGNEERNRILLQARNEKVQRANEAAQSARQQAQTAQQRAQVAESQLARERQQLADLNARQTARGLELTMASDVLFNTGSSTLKPGAMLQINRLGDFMRSNPRTRIIVEGYTDSRGSFPYNQQLSEARAQSVASALGAEGVSSDRIQTIGRGKDYPVASNTTSAGRQQNRRVDIILSDMTGRFAQAATRAPEVR